MAEPLFDVHRHRSLPYIQDANKELRTQLRNADPEGNAGQSFARLLQEFAAISREEGVLGRYAICLLHRHFLLEEGERLVSDGPIASPSAKSSPNIVAESWYSDGNEYEHRIIGEGDSLPCPSKAFFEKFHQITQKYGVEGDILGICSAPKVEPGYILLEHAGTGSRELIITTIPRDPSRPRSVYDTIWAVRNLMETTPIAAVLGGNGVETLTLAPDLWR